MRRPRYELDDAGVEPDPDVPVAPELRVLLRRVAGLVPEAFARGREALLAARVRAGRGAAAARVVRPELVAALTPSAAPRATPTTARPAVITPATP